MAALRKCVAGALALAGLLAAGAGQGLAATGTPSGITIAVIQSASASGEGGQRVLQKEGPVFSGDVIVTGAIGEAQVKFRDNTRLVVGPNSKLIIDAFIYSNNTARKLSINALKGAFRFISGNSNHDAYTITTPTATIGVRGTEIDVNADKNELLVYTGAADLCKRGSAGRNRDCVTVQGGCNVAHCRPMPAFARSSRRASATSRSFVISATHWIRGACSRSSGWTRPAAVRSARICRSPGDAAATASTASSSSAAATAATAEMRLPSAAPLAKGLPPSRLARFPLPEIRQTGWREPRQMGQLEEGRRRTEALWSLRRLRRRQGLEEAVDRSEPRRMKTARTGALSCRMAGIRPATAATKWGFKTGSFGNGNRNGFAGSPNGFRSDGQHRLRPQQRDGFAGPERRQQRLRPQPNGFPERQSATASAATVTASRSNERPQGPQGFQGPRTASRTTTGQRLPGPQDRDRRVSRAARTSGPERLPGAARTRDRSVQNDN